MLLGLRSGVEHKHVPYRGTVPGITDLVGGQIPSTLNPSGEYLSHARAGKLRFPEKYAVFAHPVCVNSYLFYSECP